MNIYVGNLSYRVKETELKKVFDEFGEVVSVKIIKDKMSGRSKGFAFVEMANNDDGQRAIKELNGFELDKRNLVVNEARPKEQNQ